MERIAMVMARTVTMVEMVPAMERLPVETKAPMSGVIKVVPQVGQPAPRAMRPVIMPAFSMLAAFCSRFFFQRRTMRPIRMPWSKAIQKTGSQSRKGWLIPKMPRKLSPIMRNPSGKPKIRMSSNFDKPPDKRFIKRPKNKKLGTKPYQKSFSLVASRIPLPAKTKPSNHFLQFINIIIAYVFCIMFNICIFIRDDFTPWLFSQRFTQSSSQSSYQTCFANL